MATQKQIDYALALMDRKGYDTRWMTAKHRNLGATCRERSGKVSDWLAGLTKAEVSNIISKLQ